MVRSEQEGNIRALLTTMQGGTWEGDLFLQEQTCAVLVPSGS